MRREKIVPVALEWRLLAAELQDRGFRYGRMDGDHTRFCAVELFVPASLSGSTRRGQHHRGLSTLSPSLAPSLPPSLAFSLALSLARCLSLLARSLLFPLSRARRTKP